MDAIKLFLQIPRPAQASPQMNNTSNTNTQRQGKSFVQVLPAAHLRDLLLRVLCSFGCDVGACHELLELVLEGGHRDDGTRWATRGGPCAGAVLSSGTGCCCAGGVIPNRSRTQQYSPFPVEFVTRLPLKHADRHAGGAPTRVQRPNGTTCPYMQWNARHM